MKFRRILGAAFAGALSLVFFAGCLDSGRDPDPGRDTVTMALARIKAVPLDGAGDTITTTFTYDANGMKVRETVHDLLVITHEYDSLGRYARWTQHDHRDTVEVSMWVTPDSSVRGSAHSTLQVRERWFGLRPNCRCADSVYRYSYNGSLSQVRRYAYDAAGNPTRVTRDHVNPARRDTAQRYENAYILQERPTGSTTILHSRIAYDAEREENTRQFFEYAPLDSLIETR